jgi:hypothetical protein
VLGSIFAGSPLSGVRHRSAFVWVIEPLEGRVVLATIPVTSVLDSGAGTLRLAIEQANLAPDHDSITFGPSLTGTIALTSALPDLSTDIDISGPGPLALTVARSGAPGTPAFRIFTVPSGVEIAISGLTIMGGSAVAGGGIENAGSLSLVNTKISGNSATGVAGASVGGRGGGGGIENSGTLSVTSSTFSGNLATGGDATGTSVGGAGSGGGIENSGMLSVTGSAFSGNSAVGGGGFAGGGAGDGGGIENSGTVLVTSSAFSGNSAHGGDGYAGGGSGDGGGIKSSGTLSVSTSTFSDNAAAGGNGQTAGSPTGVGGGIENSGMLSVTNSTFSGNLAAGGNGVRDNGGLGGGIASSGTLSVTNSTFSGNSAAGGDGGDGGDGVGGGIENSGMLSVTGSAFTGNSARGEGSFFNPGDGAGGGIANSGTLSVTSSTFSGNSATGGGTHSCCAGGTSTGGGIENSGTLLVTNSTFSGNLARGLSVNVPTGDGGGIESSGTASISYVTVADNSAINGGGIAVAAGPRSSVDSIDSIFQNAQGGNVSVAAGGSFRSLGHNLFSDAPSVSLDPTDLLNANPLLGPLADNGGPTLTRALLAGSPAMSAGFAVIGITTDQRGAPRPSGRAPDIGAFQVQPPLTVVSVGRYGVHRQPTVLVLTFNLPLDTPRAEDRANYRLVWAGPDHRLGTKDDRVISIRSAHYDSAFHAVSLRPKQRLALSRRYLLTVIGMPPGGLTTTVGAYLEGAGPGQPGRNYVAPINGKLLVRPNQHHATRHVALALAIGRRRR